MKRNLEEEVTRERTARDEARPAERRILAVGKRVRHRWLIELAFTRPARQADAGHAHAA